MSCKADHLSLVPGIHIKVGGRGHLHKLFWLSYTEAGSACTPVLVTVPTAMKKHHDQKQHEEERVYSAYASTSLSIVEGSQNRNSDRAGTWKQELMQRPWSVLTDLLPMAYSAYFLIEPRTTNTGVALPIGWALHQ